MSDVNSTSGKSLGRRPGSGDAKETIIEAARVQFAENGYDRTSMRQIAAEAAVDPALIIHYFGTKQRLFMDSMLPLLEGPRLLPSALDGDKATIGVRLATLFIGMTSDPSVQKLMLGMFRSVSSEAEAAKMARKFVQGAVIDLLEHYLPGPNKKLQANILGGQLVGVFMARYIIKVEPLASTQPNELIEYLAPRLQAHFD